MQFGRSVLLALASAVAALAQASDSPNPFKIQGATITGAKAGSPLTLSWTPTTQGTISLILRTGDRSNLMTVATIAKSIQNSGSYTWQIPSDTVNGANYAIEIVDDADPSEYNYTGQFVITSDVLTSAGSSSGSTSMTTSASTASGSSTTGSASMTTSSTSASSSASGSGSSTTGSSTKPAATTTGGAGASAASSGNAGARATFAPIAAGIAALGALVL